MEGPSGVVAKGSEEELMMELPPGFRFHPTDEEIISHYLTPKVMNSSFSAVAVGEVDLNKCEPWDLPEKAKMGEKEWYFFCNRDRKYPTGMRTNRATDSGYWKATGKDKEIYKLGSSSCLIGMKKTLVFYKGRAPKGEKTNWVMHEYRLEGEFSYYKFHSKEEWVVSRVFHKTIKISPFALPTSASPHENGPHLFEYCSSMSPLPPLVENPASSSLINENDAIDRKSKVSSPPSIDEDGDNYLSYLSVHAGDHQLQNRNINPLTCPNYNQMTNQSGSIKPNCTASFYPQVQAPNNEYLHPKRIIREQYPMQNFASRSILRGLNEVETSSEVEKQTKMEQLSSNQSMVSVSQDTGISADMTAETSSRPSDRFYGLVDIDDPSLAGPNFSDGLDYLWDY